MINLSVWTDINENVKIDYTTKKFYNQYFYKIEYEIYGASLLTRGSIKSYHHLSGSVDTFNLHSSYRKSKNFAKLSTLSDFFELKLNIDRSIAKIRIEENSFSIYSSDIDYLHDIVANKLLDCQSLLKTVYLIRSKKDMDLLDQGKIIVKKEKLYPYRVRLNAIENRKSGLDDLENLGNYIRQLDDEIKISKNLLNELRSNNKYFHGGHVYIRDPNVASMLKLISPSVIGKTHQMIQG